MAVATRHLGWRLVEVVKQIPGVNHAAAAQGIRQFWTEAEERSKLAEFVRRMRGEMSKVDV